MTADPLARLGDLPGVADAVAAARTAVDRLLVHPALRRQGGAVAAEAGLRCARASAALEGSAVELAAVRAGTDDLVVNGALRVAGGLAGLAPIWERAAYQALARLHVLAASGQARDEELGRPRADADSSRLAALVGLLAAPTSASAVVVAAVVHGELLALQPFSVCNDIVARAAARLVLITRGVDARGLTAPDVAHAAEVDAYEAAAAAFAIGDVAPWLVHCAYALELGAREGLAICESLRR